MSQLPIRYIPCKVLVWDDGTDDYVHTETELDLALVVRAEEYIEHDTVLNTNRLRPEHTQVFLHPKLSYESQLTIDTPYEMFAEWYKEYRDYWYEVIGRGEGGGEGYTLIDN
jgi:hypothetical protein